MEFISKLLLILPFQSTADTVQECKRRTLRIR